MTEQMERLSIDEIIAHCERNVQKNETTMSKELFENNEMDSWFMREYWEHRQVAEYLKEIQQYREIGTVEEFKTLKEKAEPKKIVFSREFLWAGKRCPSCNAVALYEMVEKRYKYCPNCGQKLDWT